MASNHQPEIMAKPSVQANHQPRQMPHPRGSSRLFLRGGSNNSDPSGIWNSFTRIGDEGSTAASLKTVWGTWGQASCKKRTQPNVAFRLNCSECSPRDGEQLFAVCEGNGDSRSLVQMSSSDGRYPLWEGNHTLAPGEFRFKYMIQRGGSESPEERSETLQGMWGVEEHRPLSVLPSPPRTGVLLVSDIDGTLVGNDEATAKFFWIWNEQYRPRGSELVYNTGRPFYSAHRLIKENRLLPPRALVCSEGTEIYWFGPGGADDLEPDYEWREILMLSWDYPKIKEAVQVLVQQLRSEVNDATYLPDSNGQPMIVINTPDRGKADNLAGKIAHEVRGVRQLALDMTVSSGGGNHFILLYPKGASKGTAALHCSRRLGFPAQRVMVAGDGENDVPLFEATKQGFKGAIVGNACDGLQSWVQRSPSGNLIYRSSSCEALGVLEGLHPHFQAQPDQAANLVN